MPTLVIAIILVAVLIVAVTMMVGSLAPSSRYEVADSGETAPTKERPLDRELARCRSLTAETDDERCRRAWEESRTKFLGLRRD